MTSKLDKQERVRDELVQAGVTTYGLKKSESLALYDYLSNDERVLGVIYGQIDGSSAMMVATSRRLLFIDVRALHTVEDETSYDSFGDISLDEGILFSRVEVRTKPRSYLFTYVNKACARRFLNAIEMMTIDNGVIPKKQKSFNTKVLNSDEISFLHKHSLATVSTKSANGYPYGSTMYYIYDKNDADHLYFVTKSSTKTAENLEMSPKVALTVTDANEFVTMHVQGDAEKEARVDKANQLVGLVFLNAKSLAKKALPPVAQIKDGNFVVYRTRIKTITLKRYV